MQIPETVKNRGAYQMGGSIAGSLGTSMVAGSAAGAVLGPVGALGGAIGGAIVGSRAGAAASDGVCDLVEGASDDLCEDCKNPAAKPSGQRQWGGGRLGTTDEPSQPQAIAAQPPQEQAGVGATLNSAGAAIGGAASSAGESIGKGWSWLTGGSSASENKPEASAGGYPNKPGNFQPFQGGGRTLGSAEPVERPRQNPSRLLAGGQGQQESAERRQARPQAAQPEVAPATQVETDEEYARRLQQQFLEEDQQERQHR